jgi:hypothetical protein
MEPLFLRWLIGSKGTTKNGFIRTFWDARAAIDAGIWIDIDPGPFLHRVAGYHAFYRTNIDASAISYT